MSDPLENIKKLVENIKVPFDIPVQPLSSMVDLNIAHYEPRPEDTFSYQMQLQTNQIIEKSEEQITLLNKQNEHLVANVKKLEDLLELKENELQEAKRETKKAKRYNIWMMIISIISMLVAIAAWITPIIQGGAK